MNHDQQTTHQRIQTFGFIGACLLPLVLGACAIKVHAGYDSEAPEPPPRPTASQTATAEAPASASASSTAEPTSTATPAPSATGTSAAPSASAEPVPDLPAVERKGQNLVVPGNLVFETGQSALSPDPTNEAILKQLKAYLDAKPEVTSIRVEGHTDNQGDAAANLKLSGERALAVKQWLVGKGVAETRVLAVGFGDAQPIADNATEAGRAQNRRTEFRIATIKGKNYLGKDPLGGGTEFK